jgi:hypothetical protein
LACVDRVYFGGAGAAGRGAGTVEIRAAEISQSPSARTIT